MQPQHCPLHLWAAALPLAVGGCIAASTCGRLHCKRSIALAMRNLPDRARTPESQLQVRQPSLAQNTYPGISGFAPSFCCAVAQLRRQCRRPLFKRVPSGFQVAAFAMRTPTRSAAALILKMGIRFGWGARIHARQGTLRSSALTCMVDGSYKV